MLFTSIDNQEVLYTAPRRRQRSPEVLELIRTLTNEIESQLEKLNELTDLNLLDDLLEKTIRRDNIVRGPGFRWPPPPLSSDAISIVKHIESLDPPDFKKLLLMDENEEVNGYKLYSCGDGEPIMFYSDFMKFCQVMDDKDANMSLETFKDKLDCCSDWHKMDEHGNSFGGFWDYPEESLEREHAYDLTFDKNIRLLYKLPFSKSFLIKTVDYGCSRRLECVRYSNFLGVWVQRKRAQMNLS